MLFKDTKATSDFIGKKIKITGISNEQNKIVPYDKLMICTIVSVEEKESNIIKVSLDFSNHTNDNVPLMKKQFDDNCSNNLVYWLDSLSYKNTLGISSIYVYNDELDNQNTYEFI